MKVILQTIAAVAVLAIAAHGEVSADKSQLQVTTRLASMPLAFTVNQGQWDEQVKFRADAGGATMWFMSDGACYQFTRRTGDPEPATARPHDREPDSVETMMIKASFEGANPNPVMVGLEEMEYKCNYFLGNDPSQWRTDVPIYRAVMYKEVYDGIDLKYYGNGVAMEYDFIVEPGADYSQISIAYEGARSVAVNTAGELVVTTDWGEVVEQRPVIYQQVDGARVPVDGKYTLRSATTFGFELESYDPAQPLTIDPVLEYSTYLGGGVWDAGSAITVDALGSVYVTGYSTSPDFPTLNPYQTDQSGYDVFVTKLSGSGSNLAYSTYLGGGAAEFGYGIAVDASGSAYITGYTTSSDFPTRNQYQSFQGENDVFVTKLSSFGNSLVYSTCLGSELSEYGSAITVDPSGSAYVTGSTSSTDFPTLNPYQMDQPGADVFVTKLGSGGNSLVYSTYLGGDGEEYGGGIAIDTTWSAYVTGYTSSLDFPTLNAYQTDQDGLSHDAFVTKLDSDGSSLIYSTYLGGASGGETSNDYGSDIAVDALGSAYVTGSTSCSDFPTLNPFQTNVDEFIDAFVTKLSSDGTGLVFSTYLGGGSGFESADDFGSAIAVDASGSAYVTGSTSCSDFPTVNPLQTDQNEFTSDAFVTKLSSAGTSLVYSTYLGTASSGNGIAIDASGSAYVTGFASSSDFPTLNPFQTDQGALDAFVLKLQADETGCCIGVTGDANNDGSDGDVADIVYLVEFAFGVPSGPAPVCPEEADANGDASAGDVADIVYLVEFAFSVPSGPAPVDCP